jgi:hypothetical protein
VVERWIEAWYAQQQAPPPAKEPRPAPRTDAARARTPLPDPLVELEQAF